MLHTHPPRTAAPKALILVPSLFAIAAIAAVASTLTSARTAGAAAGQRSRSAAETPIEVWYWNMTGRAGHIFWMLDEARRPYTHHMDPMQIVRLSSAFDGRGDNFAPPILREGELLLSQSVAICVHLGRELGFADGIPDEDKALQHLLDVLDFFNEVGSAAVTTAELHTFTETGRLHKWLGNIEQSIVGPHFYGDKLTYVDFFLTMGVEWAQNRIYNALKPTIGDQFEPYPKLCEAVRLVRATDGFRRNRLPKLIPQYVPPPEFVEEYARGVGENWRDVGFADRFSSATSGERA